MSVLVSLFFYKFSVSQSSNYFLVYGSFNHSSLSSHWKITIPVKLVSTTCVAEIYTLLQTSRKMGRTKLCHHPPRPTIHHHPLPAKIHPPLPTTSQKMDHHPAKAKIYSYVTSFWHYFNSFFFFEMQYCFPWRRFGLTKFW